MSKTISTVRKKVKTVLQYDAAECGAASLATILQYYGRIEPLRILREKCGVSRDGSKASNVVKAARLYGFTTKAYTCPADKCKTNSRFPAIIFWCFNHFLVLEGFDEKFAYLSDPARGRYKVSFEEFEQKFTGIVIELEPNNEFQKGGQSLNLLARVKKFLFPFRSEFKFTLLISIAIVVPNLIIAGLTSQFVNSFLQQNKIYFGIPIIWIMFLSSILLLLLISLRFLILRRIENLFSKKLTAELFTKLTKVPFSFYLSRFQGEVALRMLLGLSTSSLLVSQIATFFVESMVSVLIILFTIFISPYLTAIVLIITIINVAFNFYLTKLRENANQRLSLEKGKSMGKGIQGIANMEMIKSSGLEYDFLSQWQASFGKVVYETQQLGAQMAYSNILSQSSSFLSNALVITVGGILIVLGKLSLGGLLAFQFLQSDITRPIQRLPQLSSSLQTFIGDLGRLDDLINNSEDPLANGLKIVNSNNSINQKDKLSGRIELKDLTFSFSSLAPPFLNNINLTIPAGSMVSFVGPSGSGKSTLIGIIAGLYSFQSGEIYFDNTKRSVISPDILTSSISYVAQKIFIFNTSVWNNITLWNPIYEQNDLEIATKDSEIYGLISSHPDLFQRQLEDNGRNLSGGEKQRLEIARGLVSLPSILILDEATSALDNKTQDIVISNIKKRNITVLNISHRLETALKSDFVYVLEKGSIVESGDPSVLASRDSVFSKMIKAENSESVS